MKKISKELNKWLNEAPLLLFATIVFMILWIPGQAYGRYQLGTGDLRGTQEVVYALFVIMCTSLNILAFVSAPYLFALRRTVPLKIAFQFTVILGVLLTLAMFLINRYVMDLYTIYFAMPLISVGLLSHRQAHLMSSRLFHGATVVPL